MIIVNRHSDEKWGVTPIPERVAERAATKHDLDENGCFISRYSVASHGYAQIGWQESGKTFVTTVHRAAWVYANEKQIPLGMTLDHICKNKRCVNPEHLRLLTNYENARRTSGRDWELGECANGHPNSELYWDGSRTRCRICVKESRKRYVENNRESIAESRRRYVEKYPERVKESKRKYAEKKKRANS